MKPEWVVLEIQNKVTRTAVLYKKKEDAKTTNGHHNITANALPL